jgi:hypothetical protein
MKKLIFTLNVNDFSPEITKITYPLMKSYANKIGADFMELTERKFPDMPPNYEKFQVWELSNALDYDWFIFFDADTLIHPNFFDVTVYVPFDTVAFNGKDQCNVRFRYDRYMRRDGRHIGACTWFVVWSKWCTDLWYPIDIPLEEAVSNIFPTQNEINCKIDKEHLLDDYLLSRNIARFGLKHMCMRDVYHQYGCTDYNFIWHQYTWTKDQKVIMMQQVLEEWGIHPVSGRFAPPQYINPAPVGQHYMIPEPGR